MLSEAPRHSTRSLWTDLGIVAAVGIVARVLFLVFAPGTMMFADTYSYLMALFAHGSPIHASDLAYVWWAGTFGTYSVTSVAVLQMVLGLLCGLAVADGLRRIAPRWIALAAALVFISFPPLLGFERVFLSEPLCVDLGALSLWALIRLLTTKSPQAHWGWAAALAAALGLMVVVRPALLIAVLSVLSIGLVVLVRSMPRIWWRRVGLIALTLLIFAIPLVGRSERNHASFGTWSLAPDSTAYLFARWAPLIPCPTPQQHLTPAARHDMEHACKVATYGTIPGEITDMIWDKVSYHGINALHSAENQTTQQQLASAVRSAMLHHPVAVAQQVGASIWYQTFGAPANDLHKYRATVLGNRTSKILKQNLPGGHRIAEFLRGSEGDERKLPPLFGLLNATNRWPQYLLWVDLVFGGIIAVLAMALRRRPSVTWLGSPTVLVGLACIGFCVGEMLNIALGAYAVFRYLFPLVPWLVGLLALELGAMLKLAGRTRTGDSGRTRSAGGA